MITAQEAKEQSEINHKKRIEHEIREQKDTAYRLIREAMKDGRYSVKLKSTDGVWYEVVTELREVGFEAMPCLNSKDYRIAWGCDVLGNGTFKTGWVNVYSHTESRYIFVSQKPYDTKEEAESEQSRTMRPGVRLVACIEIEY